MRNVFDNRFNYLLTYQVNNSLKEAATKEEKKKKRTEDSETKTFQTLLDFQLGIRD